MSQRELARRRIVAAMMCAYGVLFLLTLAASALGDDEDQAAELDRCPFDEAPVDEPMSPAEIDRLMARDAATYRAGYAAGEASWTRRDAR
jgi:hypothetical protein